MPRLLHRFLIGAAAGLAAGDLLLGLNAPLLEPLPAARLLGGVALTAGLLGALAAARREPEERGRGAWLLAALALAGAGLLVESQRDLNYLFIGNGTRRLLVATSAVAFVLSLVCLVAAVVRAGSRAARCTAAAAVVLFALVPLAGRRAPERERLAASSVLPRTPSRGLLVVGIDGASWELLTTGASDGSLPTVARLLKEGVAGPLGTLAPYDRPSTWVSAATGKRPSKHGVVTGTLFETPLGVLALLPRFRHGEPLESLPLSTALAVDGEGRRSLTFWEILATRGHRVTVLGWPAAGGRPGAGPESERSFEAAQREVDPQVVASLQPRDLLPDDIRRAGGLSGAARDLAVVDAALAALPDGPGSVSALVLTSLSLPARVYGPAALPGRYLGAGKAPDVRSRALLGHYRLIDQLVGELWERAGKDRTVCLFAPIGYGPPPLRQALFRLAAGREPEAIPDPRHAGFVVLTGSGIRAGARLTSANLFDLAPTLLALAGEPVARDFDGRVLAEAFDERFAERTSIPIIVSFEPGGPQ